jgi:phosphate transport system substrate-binding protein
MKNNLNTKTKIAAVLLLTEIVCTSCGNSIKDDYKNNSPTSGKLRVFYDEGLSPHVRNQAATFEGLYERADIELYETSENEAVQALYHDSCESIVISRQLTLEEQKAFASKMYFPHFSPVAKSGIVLIANAQSAIKTLRVESLIDLLAKGSPIKDSTGAELSVSVLFDKNNSSVLHYMLDSVVKEKKLAPNCNILGSTLESINYVAKNQNAMALIDFAWLSDIDDSIFKANRSLIRMVALSKKGADIFELPSPSSFKLNTYPLVRTIYVFRKTGDFSLAKGFESFVAGPKGQLIFLKQGLLPARQSERQIEVKMGQHHENTGG